MTRVLLTGASGYIGLGIWRALASSSDIDILPVARSERLFEAPLEKVLPIDLLDRAATEGVVRKFRPDVVINAAGRMHGGAGELFADNAVATINLADALCAMDPRPRLIALGSAAEYGRPSGDRPIAEDHPCRPLSVYGHSKMAATRYLLSRAEEQDLQLSLLRIFNLVGSANQVVGAFVERAMNAYEAPAPRVVEMGRLDAIRDFICLSDLAGFVRTLVVEEKTTGVVNVCSGRGYCVRDLVAYANRLAGDRFTIREQGNAPRPGMVDRVVGDPSHFFQTGGISELRSVFNDIDAVWRQAHIEKFHS